ncbi:MAG: Holliday junction branch migration protein RuvA [bacterium]
MIGFLHGRLLQKRPPFLLLDVNGVGYELEAPMTTFYDLPDDDRAVSLFVHLVVREDAQLLFGFSDQPQRELFRGLLRVNGVGPRVALAVLSSMSADQFVACIQRQDAGALARVPGIGKKTAERMLLDLRDRIDALAQDDSGDASAVADPAQDAVGALIALGYKAADANRAVRAVEQQGGKREALIRNALQHLSK